MVAPNTKVKNLIADDKKSFTNELYSVRLGTEIDLIFKVQVLRILTLSSNFSACIYNDKDEKSFKELPELAFNEISLPLLIHFFDLGRCNSLVTLPTRHSISFFEDAYHREPLNLHLGFSLVQETCVLSSPVEEIKFIPIVESLIPLITLYINDMCKLHKVIYTIQQYTITYPRVGFAEAVYLLATDTSVLKETLHGLGMLGALPNRDWQLKLYAAKFDKRTSGQINPRELQVRLMGVLHKDHVTTNLSEVRLIYEVNISLTQQKNKVLALLSSQQKNYEQNNRLEQRYFYYQVLYKLICGLDTKENEIYSKQHKYQLFYSLKRIETLIQDSEDISYPSFLRIIESCIDELHLFLTLYYSSKPRTTKEVRDVLTRFIEHTVKIKPQMATLRSSCMQAIWSSVLMAFDYFKIKKAPFRMLVSENCYFEVINVMQNLFDLNHYQCGTVIDMVLDQDLNAKHQGYEQNALYDIYLTLFESNIQHNRSTCLFNDISKFIEHQLKLRTKAQDKNRPFIVIIDHTMSDYTATYLTDLTDLLLRFNEEINSGCLCILVAHSGNKYLHLGTDKVLASLLYGYYNPDVFASIDNLTTNEQSMDKLGDFDPNSPCIVLTTAFLDHARNEILAYGPFIRERTLQLFKEVIPVNLINTNNFFSIDSPLIKNQDLVKNNHGFITIRCRQSQFSHCTAAKLAMDSLLGLSRGIGIKGRDGFAFNQTTQVDIRFGDQRIDIIRISVGTESFDSLANIMQLLCNFLEQVNVLFERYTKNSQLDSAQLSEEVKNVYQQALDQYAMLKEDSPAYMPILHH